MTAKVGIHGPSGLPMIDDGSGTMRVLARLAPYPRNPFAALSHRLQLPGPDQWQEIDLSNGNKLTLKDQGSTSSCVGHGTCTCFEAVWLQSGQPEPPGTFSGCYVYGWINGGRDEGAVISDAATALKMHGCCTEREVPEGMIFKRQFPQAADQVAARYKPSQVLRCSTYDEIIAAISMGFPVVIGILVGRNFSNLDGNGVAPLPDMVLGGHCLAGIESKKHPQYGWLLGVQNSWGRGWGVNGTGRVYLRREHFENPTDAFAILGAVHDPGDTSITPAQA